MMYLLLSAILLTAWLWWIDTEMARVVMGAISILVVFLIALGH